MHAEQDSQRRVASLSPSRQHESGPPTSPKSRTREDSPVNNDDEQSTPIQQGTSSKARRLNRVVTEGADESQLDAFLDYESSDVDSLSEAETELGPREGVDLHDSSSNVERQSRAGSRSSSPDQGAGLSQLQATITGGMLRDESMNRSVALLPMEAVRSNPAETAYDAFYKYLDANRQQITNADDGLGPAFMTSVMKPIDQMKVFGSTLHALSGEYGPTMFIIAQLFYRTFIRKPTDNVEETAAMDAVFAKEYKAAFEKDCKILPTFKTQLGRFPEFLKLQCFQREIDNAQLAENVDSALRLSYIINDASRAIHKLLHRMFQGRCDGLYGRSSKDVKFKATNLEDMLHWLARFCQERRGAFMMVKNAHRSTDPYAVVPPGTEAELVAYFRRDEEEMLTKHEKQKKKSKGKGKATEATAPPTPAPANPSSSSSSRSKRKADEVDSDDAGGEAAGGEAAGGEAAGDEAAGGEASGGEAADDERCYCKGDTFKVPKKLADLLLSKQRQKAVTFREVDGVVVIDD
ncbi:hypothetical protein HDU77_000393 [Chytriomyces hyalinus]|nr:hypothetical protein HDU77_000393 [Chytriomyces hyalinus]